MDQVIKCGYVEEAHEAYKGKVWCIPYHGVYHQNTTRLRLVFDCSARYGDTELTDHLLTGPDRVNSFVAVLLRFRQESITHTCNVKAMFHQFVVPLAQRDMFRFLWWSSGDLYVQPTAYHMSVHLFVATFSPRQQLAGGSWILDSELHKDL